MCTTLYTLIRKLIIFFVFKYIRKQMASSNKTAEWLGCLYMAMLSVFSMIGYGATLRERERYIYLPFFFFLGG